MQTFAIGENSISVFPGTELDSPIIYLNTFFDEGQKVYEATQASGGQPFTLVAISDLNWTHDMVLMDSPPILEDMVRRWIFLKMSGPAEICSLRPIQKQ